MGGWKGLGMEREATGKDGNGNGTGERRESGKL